MTYHEVFYILSYYDPTFHQWTKRAQDEIIRRIMDAWEGRL